jgi:glutamate-ammonia-ligase adenylyltransferase
MLVTSYASFDRHHDESAAPWERVALLRARPVFAATRGRARTPERHNAGASTDVDVHVHVHVHEDVRFDDRLEAIIFERPLAEDTLRAELLRMRRRIEEERQGQSLAGPTPSGPSIHLRFSPGGLTDLEFLAAFFQLRLGAQDRALRTTTPLEALRRLVARGPLAAGDAVLLDDYEFLQGASLRLRLLRDRADDWLASADFPRLARALGMDETRVADEIRSRMRRVRRAFSRLVGEVS